MWILLEVDICAGEHNFRYRRGTIWFYRKVVAPWQCPGASEEPPKTLIEGGIRRVLERIGLHFLLFYSNN